MNIRAIISEKIRQAMTSAGIPAECQAHVTASTRPDFGDFQANGAMASARLMKTNPRQLAKLIVENLQMEGMASKVEIAGPGFINIHLTNEYVSRQLDLLLQHPTLGVSKASRAQTVVVDYSSPNLAKEMHVGHLRSTIIGDALVRTLEFLGHHVIRQNHMGDWGTQFGMLIAELEEHLGIGEKPEMALNDLEVFYQRAKQHFDRDPDFADKARAYVVKLQSGDRHCLDLWHLFIAISEAHSEQIYQDLNVTLTRKDIRPESAYNEDLAPLVRELRERQLAVEDQGAQVVFLSEPGDKNDNAAPLIVQKSGGGYLYATTDLAAIRYRCQVLRADRILYFIDARQSLHMKQVFAVARKAGFAPQHVQLEHHAFGTMMGSDGKPFKTRSGGTVKLHQLLLEAIDRADRLIAEKDPELSFEMRSEVARKVGIGAVKYADLSKTRTNDYVFNWDAMLSFEGNTAPYLQYAYTRVRSIFRRAGIDPESHRASVNIADPIEKQLALKLLGFGEVVEQVAAEAYPHILCNYLYELATGFMSFYEHCPILKAGVNEVERDSRLVICQLTAAVLAQGLELLGIEIMERM